MTEPINGVQAGSDGSGCGGNKAKVQLPDGSAGAFLPAWTVLLSLSLMGLVTVTACGGDGGSTGPDEESPPPEEESRLATVVISPSRAVISNPGGAQQFTATATDQNGEEILAVEFNWSVSDASVATVNGEEVATAQSDGAVAVEAEASGVTGTAALAVRTEAPVWDAINASKINSCGITTHATLYCWGSNDHGELGIDEPMDRVPDPVLIDTDLFFLQVVGSDHICALTPDGTAYCWGDSANGERGTREFGDRFQATPEAVRTSRRFTQLTTGGGHTCGLAMDGTALCWGKNSNGQLGDGTSSRRAVPIEVDTDLSFSHISAGAAYTGDHTCAIATDGSAHCWGANFYGELGEGSTENRHSPVAVEGGLNFEEIGAGGSHTCGLTTAGAAYCWGLNTVGQLGDASSQESRTPIEVAGGHTFVQLQVGENHACGLTAAGAAYCWGLNRQGQLGDGTNELRRVPVEVTGGHTFDRLDAGATHTCGLTTDLAYYCWGENQDGQLGDGTSQDRSHPVRVPEPWI